MGTINRDFGAYTDGRLATTNDFFQDFDFSFGSFLSESPFELGFASDQLAFSFSAEGLINLPPLQTVGGLAITNSASAVPAAATPEKSGKLSTGLSSLIDFGNELAAATSSEQRASILTRAQNELSHATLIGEYIVVDAFASDDEAAQALLAELTDLGLLQGAAYKNAVSGLFPLTSLGSLQDIDLILSVGESASVANSGSVATQADISTRSDIARSLFNVDGSGSAIGVLSDSFNNLNGFQSDIATGDLPSFVNVLEDLPLSGDPASDEGRAILQLIHDIAPGADLLFSTAFLGIANFAQSIIALADAGANIIIDDVAYFATPFFQDGLIAQAVDEVAARGVLYFSSAGNSGTRSYESQFRNSGQIVTFTDPETNITSTGVAHDFDPGAQVDIRQLVSLGDGDTLSLSFQYDEPTAVAGSSGPVSDYDIVLVEAGTNNVLAASFTSNAVRPVEIITFTNETGSTQQYELVFFRFSGNTDNFIKYIDFSNDVNILEFNTNSPTLVGQANAAGAIAVGASAFFNNPEFGVNPPVLNGFSSVGGNDILFDTAGNRLATPDVRRGPAFTAPDGGNTTFFGNDIGFDSDSFPNFFGTSASAPAAAAIAALLLDAAPTATPEQVIDALSDTAIDIGTPGFDLASGAGLIQADAAISALLNTIDGADDFVGTPSDDTLTGNENPNMISGLAGNDSITGLGSDDTLNGDSGNDTLFGGEGNDQLLGNDGLDNLNGDNGNDTLDGGAGTDTLLGGSGNDSLIGGNEADQIDGGADNDVIEGGDGNDVLTGGSGDDTLTGGEGNDQLLGNDGLDNLNGDNGNDTLDGGAGTDTLLGGSGNDSLIGGNEADQIDGGADNDVIEGGDGNDVLTGGSGDDTLTGGEGNDQLLGNDGLDNLNGDNGNDTLDGGAGTDTLLGGSGNDSLIGGNEADQIDGGADNDVIEGGDGNDVLTGGSGDDTLTGGEGDDFLDGEARFDSINGDAGNDTLIGGSGQDSLDGGADNDSLEGGTNFDTLEGGDGNDFANGGEAADTINGGAGNDTLIGESGADVLNGGLDDDVLDGGAQQDTLDGGAGNDTLLGGTNFDTLIGGTGDDSLDGGEAADLITGDAGMDTLDGGSGNDILQGGADNDTLLGGITGMDTLEGGDGDDFLDGSSNFDSLVGGDGNDTLLGGPTGADTLIGGTGNDSLEGGTNFDTLEGGAGNDTLIGGEASDLLDGGIGDDEIRGDSGFDTINGGDGNDQIIGDIGADLLDGGTGNDTISGGTNFDTLIGGTGDDNLDGGGAADTINGGIGNDTLDGGSGADLLEGDDGNDLLLGGLTGRDTLRGGAGNDTLEGGSNFDTLEGGSGDDLLTGGTIGDVFIFADGFGNDIITDFQLTATDERIDLSAVADITDFTDLITNHLSSEPITGDAVITVGMNTITLTGIDPNNLLNDDFIF